MGGKHEYGVEAPFLCFDNDKFERGGFFVVGIFFCLYASIWRLASGENMYVTSCAGIPYFLYIEMSASVCIIIMILHLISWKYHIFHIRLHISTYISAIVTRFFPRISIALSFIRSWT